VRLWPTPTASDYRGAQTLAACKRWRSRGRNQPEAVVLAEAAEHSLPQQAPGHPTADRIEDDPTPGTR